MDFLKKAHLLGSNHRESFYERYEGTVDEYGFDLNTFAKWEPFFRFFFEGYFQVKVIGIENIPAEGPVIIMGNHSGGLPIDAVMLNNANYNLHPNPRRMRALSHEWLHNIGLIGTILRGLGAVPANFGTAMKLLNNGEIVVFYPEGARGTGKLYTSRYRIIDFDPGFVKAAVLSGAPVVPVTTVGGDEIYPILASLPKLAKLLDMPYYPVTPTFPLLPICSSCIPLPVKMLIKIHKPVRLDCSPDQAGDKKLRMQITREFQFMIQRQLNILLAKRKSPFEGWSPEDLQRL